MALTQYNWGLIEGKSEYRHVHRKNTMERLESGCPRAQELPGLDHILPQHLQREHDPANS